MLKCCGMSREWFCAVGLLACVLFVFSGCGDAGGSGTVDGTADVSSPDISFGEDGWCAPANAPTAPSELPTIPCTGILDCPAEQPFCDIAKGSCAQCMDDTACGGDFDCISGACVPKNGCVPGAKKCDGNQLLTCLADGSGFSNELCSGGCSNCQCTACLPNQLGCDGNVVIQCDSTGFNSTPVEQCPLFCVNGACTVCLPDMAQCDGTMVQVCNADGTGYVNDKDCATTGEVCFKGKCIDACGGDLKFGGNVGCDYWAVDLDNHYDAQDGPFAVIVSNLSDEAATVTITSKTNPGQTQATQVANKVVASGGLEIFSFPQQQQPNGANIGWNAYRIQSTSPIIAYQFNPLENVDVFSNDASLLLPSNTYGTEYIVTSRAELLGGGPDVDPLFGDCNQVCAPLEGGYCDFNGQCLVPYRGTLTVMANSADTLVTIRPTTVTLGGAGVPAMQPGQDYNFTLQPYQTLNVKTDQDGGDLTGSIVTANKPIAVFGGHEAAVTSDRCCADHLEQQMFPVTTWGKSYVASKSMTRALESDYWRVMAAEDGTNISFAPAVHGPAVLNRGQWIEVVTQQDFVVTATKPVSVAQFLASSQEILEEPFGAPCNTDFDCSSGYTCTLYDFDANFNSLYACFPPQCSIEGSPAGCPAGHNCACFSFECSCHPIGDPALILSAPVEQFRDKYVFLTPNKYVDDYINIVAPLSATVTVDGMNVPEVQFETVAGSQYKVCRLKVADGVHEVNATEPIGVTVYGYDKDVSYGYTAGLNLNDL